MEEILSGIETLSKDVEERMNAGLELTQEQFLLAMFTGLLAAVDLAPLLTELTGEVEEMRELLTAETIDREAVEALRAPMIARIDAMSHTAFEYALTMAGHLTREQREFIDRSVSESLAATR